MFFLEAGGPIHYCDYRRIRGRSFRNRNKKSSIRRDIVTMGSRELASGHGKLSFEQWHRSPGLDRPVAFYRDGHQLSIQPQVIQFASIAAPFRFDAAL